jgi:hypothetical protein
MEEGAMIKNFTKTLSVANWILCLIVSFISSSNATDEVVNTIFSGGAAVTIHDEHRPRLSTLCKLGSKDRADWNKGLTEIGYLKLHSSELKMLANFDTNYGALRGKDTQQEAALASWQECDQFFEEFIIANVKSSLKSYLKREGLLLTPKEIEVIKDRLNPDRGTVRLKGTYNRFHILTLDKNSLVKLHLSLNTDYDISSEWTCYRYTARMKCHLDLGIYKFLGD